MLLRTPRFIALGFPSSYSMPAAPPSPDIRSKRSRSSASAWAVVLVLFGIDGCLSVVEGVSLFVLVDDWVEGFFEESNGPKDTH